MRPVDTRRQGPRASFIESEELDGTPVDIAVAG